MARDSLSSARVPAFPGRSASFFPSSVLLVFRTRRALRSAGVPRALTGGRGRQSAGGRVPAPGLRRRIGGARGPGWEAGLPLGRGGGGAAPSQQPASAERAARRWVRRAAAAGSGGRRAEAEVGRRAQRGRARPSRPPGVGARRARARGEEGRWRDARPHPLLPAGGGRARAPSSRAGVDCRAPAGGRGGWPGGRESVFSSASNRPFPSPLPAPHPIRKRKEQKVPDPRL